LGRKKGETLRKGAGKQKTKESYGKKEKKTAGCGGCVFLSVERVFVERSALLKL